MAEAARFTIGVRASCPDGFCGTVSRLVIDPVARTVTHLVGGLGSARGQRPGGQPGPDPGDVGVGRLVVGDPGDGLADRIR